jgi:hypothetical protein
MNRGKKPQTNRHCGAMYPWRDNLPVVSSIIKAQSQTRNPHPQTRNFKLFCQTPKLFIPCLLKVLNHDLVPLFLLHFNHTKRTKGSHVPPFWADMRTFCSHIYELQASLTDDTTTTKRTTINIKWNASFDRWPTYRPYFNWTATEPTLIADPSVFFISPTAHFF